MCSASCFDLTKMMMKLMQMAAIAVLLMERKIGSRAVQAVGGPGCVVEDLRRLKRELNACLPQFFEPAAFALPQSRSCCANESAHCCYGLRSALPVGDACICTFMLHAVRRSQGRPYSLDVPSALLQLSSQCRVDFGYSSSASARKCGPFYIP
ncbi:hypothetical protein GOP47_0013166 [Adiantum capillus-veneris]|uniref:Uncharacterized protein n=1 Tax=Adiantum capillus-veneris TaxID=13818 RepID=A0A9D4ZF17_ADICA|nr:hypothetical protein GOP47_0013166 [Adiantum capillus-veneris]